jgi:hypothetical protein
MGESEEDQEDRERISEGGVAAARGSKRRRRALTERRALKEGRDGRRLLEFSFEETRDFWILFYDRILSDELLPHPERNPEA